MRPIALGPQEQIAAEQFRSFYAGLLAIRDAIAAPGGADPDAAARQPSIEEVRATLTRTIIDYGYRPGDPAQALVDPDYVMAAVADEVLLVQCPQWRDRDAWTDRPLESLLYGSGLAGERVFAAADTLVARRRDDPRTATVILLALLTGFRGRYHGRDDRGRIAALEAQLYALVCGRIYAPDDTAPYAAPQLAATALGGESGRPLPPLWPWLVAIVAVLFLYLPASHLAWWLQVSQIAQLADRVIAAAPAGTPSPGPTR
jgi:type IV/VI secretion system ImpK/VasF family protein